MEAKRRVRAGEIRLNHTAEEGFYSISRVVQGGVMRHHSLEWSAAPSLML
jgi:hypothetical protein